MNKKIIIGLMITIVAVVLAGTGYFIYQQSQPKTSNQVMRVATYYWPGTYWVEIADQKGWFKEAGLNVKLVDTNTDYYKSLNDTAAGLIDTNNFPPFDLIEYNSKGANLVAVFNSDISSGADGIVVKKGINSIKDLKGKKIAVSSETYLGYILDTVLSQNGLDSEKDIVKIDINPEDMVKGFVAGQYDAMVNWEPNLSEAAAKGNGQIIFDSSKMFGLNSGNWVFKSNFIESRPNDVQAFVGVWNKTTNFIKNNPDEAYSIIAEIYKVTPEEVAQLEKTDRITDLNGSLANFSYGFGFESLHGTISKMNDYLLDHKLIQKEVSSLDIINPSFIRALIK